MAITVSAATPLATTGASNAPASRPPSLATDEGALASINDLMLLVQKMNAQMRDINRRFVETQSVVEFTYQQAWFESKSEAIDKEFAGALLRGFAQIGDGAFSILGAASGDPALSAGLQGAGKTGEGITGVLTAGIDRDAKQLQVGAELEMAAMKQNADEIAKAIQRAQDASNAMQQVTSQLVTLAGNMFAAVRLG